MDNLNIILALVAGVLVATMAANRRRTSQESTSGGIQEGTRIDAGELRTLTITRESQMINALAGYKIFVDGIQVGKLGNGESLQTSVAEESHIQILTGGQGATLRLRAGKEPRIHFTTMYGGAVNVTATDAEIIEIRSGK